MNLILPTMVIFTPSINTNTLRIQHVLGMKFITYRVIGKKENSERSYADLAEYVPTYS